MLWSLVGLGFLIGSCVSDPQCPEPEPVAVEKAERVHLPTKCRKFYNDGTDRWIECMGVGYK
jgi:hypothetical protein